MSVYTCVRLHVWDDRVYTRDTCLKVAYMSLLNADGGYLFVYESQGVLDVGVL